MPSSTVSSPPPATAAVAANATAAEPSSSSSSAAAAAAAPSSSPASPQQRRRVGFADDVEEKQPREGGVPLSAVLTSGDDDSNNNSSSDSDSNDSDTADSDTDDDTCDRSDVHDDHRSGPFQWPGLRFRAQDLLPFQLPVWYVHLRSHTIPTRFFPLTSEFLQYLREDGVYIPAHLNPVREGAVAGQEERDEEEEEEERRKWEGAVVEEVSSDSDSDSDSDNDNASAAAVSSSSRRPPPTSRTGAFFPSLVSSLSSSLSSFSTGAFPKLNFRAPTDAAWIATEKTLRCATVGDILLLLKSSDKVLIEIENPFEGCDDAATATTTVKVMTADAADAQSQETSASATSTAAASSSSFLSFTPTLCLRKWSSLHPSKLFRLFLWQCELVAISQLDPNFYEFLQSRQSREDIQDVIEGWLEDEGIVETLREKMQVNSCTMDVYIDLNERVWIVDIDPWLPARTSAALFGWKRMHAIVQKTERKKKEEAERRAAIAAAGDASATTDAQWPSSDSLSVPFRVIRNGEEGMDVVRALKQMKTRFPCEGFDVSDSAAIERWIQRVERGEIK